MIKINLLPFRAARRKENIKRQITIYVLSVVLVLLGAGYFYLELNSSIETLRAEKAQKKKDLASYGTTIKRIKALNKRIKEVQAKLTVIKELQKNKTGPVRLLDEIAMAVPKEKLWLTSLKENKGTLILTGTAMDNDTVALFMTNLENSKHITTVDLQSTRLKTLKKYKLNTSDFVLKCKTYSFKKKKTPKKGGRKRR